MTIKELIEQLQKFPEDTYISVLSPGGAAFLDAHKNVIYDKKHGRIFIDAIAVIDNPYASRHDIAFNCIPIGDFEHAR